MTRTTPLYVLAAFALSIFCTGSLWGAETRTPTPDEVREMLRKYNESGRTPVVQRQPQIPRGAEQFNRALALHTKKEASARELKEAASLYQAASEAGIPQASTNLALLYLEGKGVKKNVKKAVSLLNAASAKGDTQADVALARLYLNGTDVKRDEKRGEALLNKAAKAGNQNAVKMQAEYKEWKKKNEISLKQYQDLMKQLQANQVKPGGTSVQPLQLFPKPLQSLDSRFPVIPGYSYLTASQQPIPSFIAAPSQPPVFKVIPDGNAESKPVNLERGAQPVMKNRATEPEPKPAGGQLQAPGKLLSP